ncbi:MAG: serine hydrolase, partial [Chloroflexi bacterium]|nr:serine hydrolase [Chloroflexota bacterium]
LMFEPGAPGLALDVNAARALIASVLYQPHLASRQVDLPLEPVVRGDLDDLQAAIVNYLVSRGIPYNTTTSVISIAVRDLDSGMETGLNEQVLHSATSTAKIGVLATYFRYIYEEPNAEMRFRLAAAIICSSNVDANLTMAIAGNGNSAAGIGNVNTTFCQAGATNTLINRNFFIGPAGEGAVPQDYYDPAGVTPCQSGDTASLDGTLSPDVDPDLQTTAADMSQFLAMIYHCAEKGAGLAERFPGEFTQTECQWMLEILRGTRFLHLAELGIPEGVSFAHKVGYGGEALGDAGIVFSPGGDYTLVIYIWDEEMDSLDTYALSRWNIVSEISRLIYNYFNPDAPLLTPRLPPNAFGGAACVLPNWPEATINLNNINAGRFDASGDPLPGACYDWPACRPFSGWEQ